MPRSRRDEDPEDDEPESTPERRIRRGRSRRPEGVRAWDSGISEPPVEEESEEGTEASGVPRGWFGRPKRPVYFGARDTIWFEPLVALAIIALLLVGLYAYTQNWPPVYVIESGSMQHGENDIPGLINTGDLVLAQKIAYSSIVPYVVGLQSGYSTYGEYGDVVLYYPNGDAGSSPIIHRAIVYLAADPNGGYDVPQLNGLPCGTAHDAVYNVTPSVTGCGTTGLVGTLTLYRIGWQSVTIAIDLSGLGGGSGLITMGDNNFVGSGSSARGEIDEPALTPPVQSGWVVGVARGMIPWFGALKLLLEGNSGAVPVGSWEWLGVTVVGIFLAILGIHFLLRAEGIEDPRRKAEEAAHEDDEPPPHPGWFSRHLKGWRLSDDDDDEEDDRPAPSRHGKHRAGASGRPSPRVRRGRPERRSSRRDDDEDEDL